MKKYIIVSLFTIFVIATQAQILKTYQISTDTTWSSDTVKIYQNIMITDQATLHITSGVYVEIQGNYSIDVSGKIIAVGSISDSIIFTVNNHDAIDDTSTINGGWGGIRFFENEQDKPIG